MGGDEVGNYVDTQREREKHDASLIAELETENAQLRINDERFRALAADDRFSLVVWGTGSGTLTFTELADVLREEDRIDIAAALATEGEETVSLEEVIEELGLG